MIHVQIITSPDWFPGANISSHTPGHMRQIARSNFVAELSRYLPSLLVSNAALLDLDPNIPESVISVRTTSIDTRFDRNCRDIAIWISLPSLYPGRDNAIRIEQLLEEALMERITVSHANANIPTLPSFELALKWGPSHGCHYTGLYTIFNW